MNEDILKVIKMVQDGKIDAEKGTELIEALNKKDEIHDAPVNFADENKMLKIVVKSQDGDNVNVNLPIKFIKGLSGSINNIAGLTGIKGMENIDLKQILDAVSNGLEGDIVDVKSEDGDTVKISVE